MVARKKLGFEAVAVVGIIDRDGEVVHVMTRPKSIKTEDFNEFMRDFKEKIGTRKSIVFLDNLNFHRNKRVVSYCKESEINLIYNGTYSSEFMPIERLWSFAKRNFSRELLNGVNFKNSRTIHSLVRKSIDDVPSSHLKKHIQTCIHRM